MRKPPKNVENSDAWRASRRGDGIEVMEMAVQVNVLEHRLSFASVFCASLIAPARHLPATIPVLTPLLLQSYMYVRECPNALKTQRLVLRLLCVISLHVLLECS